MAISNKEKLAYVLKYAPKSDEKIQKIIRLAATMDNPKSKLTPEQKDKVKEGLSKLYSRFQEINEQKKGQTKSATKKEPYFKKALQEFKQKVGKIEYKRATSRTDIKKDIERPALKAGKRFPKEGKTTNQYGTFKNNPKKPYWENRANRMDVNQPSRSKYPKLSKGGGFDMLKEDDNVWNALGKKLIVDKVTKDEYLLVAFGQPSASPFSKSKVHSYLKSGQWSLKPSNNQEKTLSEIYEMLLAADKARTKQEVEEILEAMVKAGISDNDLIAPKTKTGRNLSSSTFSKFKDKKTEELQKKMYAKYEGKLSGNQPFTIINKMIELANIEPAIQTVKTFENKNGGNIKYAQGGYTKRYSEEDFPYLTADDFHKISEKISEDIDRKEIEKHRKLGTHEKFTKWWYSGGREKAIAKYGDDEQTAWSEAYEDFKRKGEKARFINISDKYKNGGNIKYAQGGVSEHGFFKGDKIVEVVDDKYLVIESKDGIMSVINIEKGGRFILGLDDSKDSGSRKDMGKVGLDEAMKYINYVKNQKMSNGGEIVVSDIEKKKSLKGNAKLKF